MLPLSLALLAGVGAAQLTSFGPGDFGLDRLFYAALAIRLAGGTRTAAAYSIGVAVTLLAAVLVLEDRLDGAYAGDNILTRLEVTGFPAMRDGVVVFEAAPVDDPRLPARLRLTWRSPPARPRGGDVWELVVRARVPRGSANPGGFDTEHWLFRERIGATGYVVKHSRNRLVAAGEGGPLLAARQRLAARIDRVLGDRDAGAVIKAIAIGTRHEFDPARWERYARTGTSHLMAISGLHVGLAAAASYGLVLLVLGIGRIRRNNHAAALGAAVCAAGAYVLVSGVGVPALRSFLMLATAMTVLWSGKTVGAGAAWSVAVVLVAVTTPLATASAGFLLSFAAVALLLRHACDARGLVPVSRVVAGPAGLWRLQWLLFVGLMPLTIVLFERTAPAAPVVNLIAVPVFSLLTVPLALLGLALGGPLAMLGDPLLLLAAGSVDLIERILALPWPDGRLTVRPGGIAALIVLLLLPWAILPRGWPGRALPLPVLLALVAWQPAPMPAGCFRATTLDVGQGQAVLVETRGFALLYDTGPAWPGGASAMQSRILPFLARQGVTAFDVTVVSHADTDHAGGLHALSASVPTGRLLLGEPLPGWRGTSCHRARPWQRDGVRFRFLRAGGDFEGNNASCVLEIAVGDAALLLTGDIEREAEAALVAASLLRGATVVSVPHHGSRTSSSAAFVAAVAADVAIASAAYGNRWGMPVDEVLRRWQRSGATVVTTGEQGAVSVLLCEEEGMHSFTLERDDRRRLWHPRHAAGAPPPDG
jgi:competence protein ComEC